jgi:hypothetical protein
VRNGEAEDGENRQFLWKLYGTCMEYVWNTYGTTRSYHATTTLATRRRHAGNTPAPRETGRELELFQILTSAEAGLPSG